MMKEKMTLTEFLAEWNHDGKTVLVHTSGSTGKPKPMYVEKSRMLNSAGITCDFLGLRPGDSALLCMPLDYIAGKMVVVRAIERQLHLISVKPSGHPLSDFSLGDQVDYFQENASRLFAAMVPMQVYNSLQVAVEAERLRSIRNLIIGGGAVDDKLASQLKDFPHAVWSTYGMTETLSHIALRRLNGSEASEWYHPFDSVTVSLNKEDCLVIDAPLVHEGKLVTNDRAELRERDGKIEFKILGRKDNVIDSGGIKIQIEEVEEKLKPFLSAPYMITKGPDEKFGETVILLTEQNNIAEVSELCMKALPKYWQPHYIFHVDKIPMTETSKPARAQAQKLALTLL